MRLFISITALFIIFLANAAAVAELPVSEEQAKYRALSTFAAVLEMVHHRYIDSDKASYDRLIQAAIKGMMQDLDTYTGYDSKEEHEESIRVMGGEMVGVGIIVNKHPKTPLRIITPLEGSPAEKAGIKPGARLLRINGADTAGISLQECLNLIKGASGTEVKVQVANPDGKPFETSLKRMNIVYSSIPPHGVRVIDNDIGYIRITVFNNTTATDFDKAYNKLRKQAKLQSLIIDLRNNPGGLLNSAVALASRFLPPDTVILYSSSRESEEEQTINSFKSDLLVDSAVKVAILVNEYSASAAEIFSGALMDHKRGTVIGARTFGKASVQNIQELPDGSAIRLTIGKYLTPSKKPIQGIGITPDITVKIPLQERAAFYSQLAIYPGIVKPDEKDSLTDSALAKAVEILADKGKLSEFQDSPTGNVAGIHIHQHHPDHRTNISEAKQP